MPVLTLHYRRSDDARFDHDYYVDQHLALVEKVWGPHLARIEVLKGLAGLELQSQPEFTAITLLHFSSEADLQAALQHPDSAILQKDIANFCQVPPDGQINVALRS